MNEFLKPGFLEVTGQSKSDQKAPNKADNPYLDGAKEHLKGLEGRKAVYKEEVNDLENQTAAWSNLVEDTESELQPVMRGKIRQVDRDKDTVKRLERIMSKRANEQGEIVARMEKEQELIADYKQAAIDEIERREALSEHALDSTVAMNSAQLAGARKDLLQTQARLIRERAYAASSDDELNAGLADGVALLLEENEQRLHSEIADRTDTLNKLDAARDRFFAHSNEPDLSETQDNILEDQKEDSDSIKQLAA